MPERELMLEDTIEVDEESYEVFMQSLYSAEFHNSICSSRVLVPLALLWIGGSWLLPANV